MGYIVLEGYCLTKNHFFFFKLWTLSTQQLSILGDQTFFPGLSFNLWHLGMFHLEPYQSSEGPHFGGPGGPVTLKIMYFKLTNSRTEIFSKIGGLRRLVGVQMKDPQVPKTKIQPPLVYNCQVLSVQSLKKKKSDMFLWEYPSW